MPASIRKLTTTDDLEPAFPLFCQLHRRLDEPRYQAQLPALIAQGFERLMSE